MFLLWFPPIFSHYQTARQTQSGRELLTCFTAGLHLSLHFHILSYNTILPYCCLNLETWFHTKKWWLLGCSIERWSSSHSAFWGKPEFEPEFLPVWWAVLPSPHWLLHLTGFCCASEAPTPTLWEDESPSGSSCPLVPGGSPPGGPGGCTLVTREVTTHHLHNPR
jgi:hypothetical protein